jgi:hypothetical protein
VPGAALLPEVVVPAAEAAPQAAAKVVLRGAAAVTALEEIKNIP